MRCVHLGMMGVLMFVAGFAAMGQLALPPYQNPGSDTDFTVAADITVDLSRAVYADQDKEWDETPGAGNGVYDPRQWAVIFRFTDVNIDEGATVRFTNHPSRAPVIWLVEGDVTINGILNVSGQNGEGLDDVGPGGPGNEFTEPGPGGFRGGRGAVAGSTDGSPGLGLGGGGIYQGYAGGSFADGHVIYGNSGCFPLIGGSGGCGARHHYSPTSGGAGGGALLIAATGTISIGANGKILADGGSGYVNASGGSGGMIRLVADTLSGSGRVQAAGGGGNSKGHIGRIRIEVNTNNFSGPVFPLVYPDFVPSPLRLFRDAATPRLTPRLLGGRPIPEDPKASLGGLADVYILKPEKVILEVEAENVPPNMDVYARIARRDGHIRTSEVQEAKLVMTKSDGANSTWQGEIEVVQGMSAVQVHARFVD